MKKEKNLFLFKKIKQLSNLKKFRIIFLTQGKPLDVSSLSKFVEIAFNKCSNYCTELEKNELIQKNREGKNVLIKSRVKFSEKSIIFN